MLGQIGNAGRLNHDSRRHIAKDEVRVTIAESSGVRCIFQIDHQDTAGTTRHDHVIGLLNAESG